MMENSTPPALSRVVRGGRALTPDMLLIASTIRSASRWLVVWPRRIHCLASRRASSSITRTSLGKLATTFRSPSSGDSTDSGRRLVDGCARRARASRRRRSDARRGAAPGGSRSALQTSCRSREACDVNGGQRYITQTAPPFCVSMRPRDGMCRLEGSVLQRVVKIRVVTIHPSVRSWAYWLRWGMESNET